MTLPKNPNVLAGHEGQLLQVVHYEGHGYDVPKRGDIVMFIECSDPEDDFTGWVRVLHGEKVHTLKVHPRKWMMTFIPWPRGGFVG